MEMVFVSPPPVTVIVPDRDEEVELAVILTETVPLFDPDAGETENQVDEPRLTDQFVLDVILKVAVCAEEETLIEFVDTVKFIFPDCVTLMVLSVTPVALKVSVAFRDDEPELASALTVTEPLFDPDAGDADSQDALLLTVQFVLDVTEIDLVEADELKEIGSVGTTVKIGIVFCVTVNVTGSADPAEMLIEALLVCVALLLGFTINSLPFFAQSNHEGLLAKFHPSVEDVAIVTFFSSVSPYSKVSDVVLSESVFLVF